MNKLKAIIAKTPRGPSLDVGRLAGSNPCPALRLMPTFIWAGLAAHNDRA